MPRAKLLILGFVLAVAGALAGFILDTNLVLVDRWLDHPWILAGLAVALLAALVVVSRITVWLSAPLVVGLASLLVCGGFLALLGPTRTEFVETSPDDGFDAVVRHSGFKAEWETITIRERHGLDARFHRADCAVYEVVSVTWQEEHRLVAEVFGEHTGESPEPLRVSIADGGEPTVDRRDRSLCLEFSEGGP